MPTATGLSPEIAAPSTPTQPTPAGVNARLVHHADGGTELSRHAEAVATLLGFLKQPLSAGTSQLLSSFEAIPERVYVQAVADMPSSSSERLLPLETQERIPEWLPISRDVASVSPANAEVLARSSSSSTQQRHLPETRAVEKRAASREAGSGAGSLSPATKIPRESAEPRS
ncbi:hypothetical protein [Pandoraea pulmonicola]|nr:hypothetical protein [Pandoraea pulmonicola]